MSENDISNPADKEMVRNYEIKQSIVFSNNRGFALAENPQAVQPFVTWQFTEENGKRDYYWGHYSTDENAAKRDYEARITEHEKNYGVSERPPLPVPETYQYYSTQRPIDIGTFPKTQGGPTEFENFDKRIPVEGGALQAWGVLHYSAPLTEKQIADYELRASPGNPDQLRLTPEQSEHQAQVVGKWEQSKRIPDIRRLTWTDSDFGVFVKKEFVTDKQLSERFNEIAAWQKAKPSIASQLAEGARQADSSNTTRPTPEKSTDKGR